jgi:putative transposase
LHKPAVNHKRIYRIMRQNGLLLTRHTGKQPQRSHEGKVITLRSNLRWCSDGFEIACWNGQVVRVAFALDCCDREVISQVATTGGITGEMVRDLMIESVERRFGTIAKLPHRVEWLSDNGSCYTATKQELLLRISDSLAASHLSEAPNPTAWPKPSSRPSNGIIFMSTIALMQQQ